MWSQCREKNKTHRLMAHGELAADPCGGKHVVLVQESIALPCEEKLFEQVLVMRISPSSERDSPRAEHLRRLLDRAAASSLRRSDDLLHFVGRGHETRVQYVDARGAVDAALLAELEVNLFDPAPDAAQSDGEGAVEALRRRARAHAGARAACLAARHSGVVSKSIGT